MKPYDNAFDFLLHGLQEQQWTETIKSVRFVVCSGLTSVILHLPLRCVENILVKYLLCANQFIHLHLHPTAMATESGLAESWSASAAVRPFHWISNHVGPGDCGFCEAASWFPRAHEGGPDRFTEDFYHWGLSWCISVLFLVAVALILKCLHVN